MNRERRCYCRYPELCDHSRFGRFVDNHRELVFFVRVVLMCGVAASAILWGGR